MADKATHHKKEVVKPPHRRRSSRVVNKKYQSGLGEQQQYPDDSGLCLWKRHRMAEWSGKKRIENPSSKGHESNIGSRLFNIEERWGDRTVDYSVLSHVMIMEIVKIQTLYVRVKVN
jgi:hypothetical protein